MGYKDVKVATLFLLVSRVVEGGFSPSQGISMIFARGYVVAALPIEIFTAAYMHM